MTKNFLLGLEHLTIGKLFKIANGEIGLNLDEKAPPPPAAILKKIKGRKIIL